MINKGTMLFTYNRHKLENSKIDFEEFYHCIQNLESSENFIKVLFSTHHVNS